MKVINTKLKDCVIFEPKVFGDNRGFFFESYEKNRYEAVLGKNLNFVQDNVSRSSKSVLRGLHFQKKFPQGKLVSVLAGEVFDVVVDLRVESETFGEWFGVILNDQNKRQMWVPPGFAHGFCVLSESADFMYKCTDYYNPKDEGGLLWNDETLRIKWPVKDPIVSDKDQLQMTYKEFLKE